MDKWTVQWDIGYGPDAEIIEAKDQDEADNIAYECWREAAEMNADYYAEPYTKELA
jgi:hypothetical protein